MDRWMDGWRWFFAWVERGARSIRKYVSWLCAAWLLCWVFVSLKLLPITLCLLVLYLPYHSMLPCSPLNAVLLCAKIDYSQCCSSVFCCFIWLSHVSWYCWPVILLLCIFCCFFLICMGCESWVHCCFKILNDSLLGCNGWMEVLCSPHMHKHMHTNRHFKKNKKTTTFFWATGPKHSALIGQFCDPDDLSPYWPSYFYHLFRGTWLPLWPLSSHQNTTEQYVITAA